MMLSLSKFSENLPVTTVVAITQSAIGVGAGLLLAGLLNTPARQRTALALILVGAAATTPVFVSLVESVLYRPGSSRHARRQLESIRRGHYQTNGNPNL